MKKGRPSAVQTEIGQSKPFRSRGQEATAALLRTASVISRIMSRIVEPHGLSLAQYNALRIIRGAGNAGIPTLAIRERMLDQGTTITRLVDKLEDAGYIERDRSLPDRRQVICRTTREGKALLDQLDPLINQADAEVMSTLSARRLGELIGLLDDVRAANPDAYQWTFGLDPEGLATYLSDWVGGDTTKLRVASPLLPDSDASRNLVERVRDVQPPEGSEALTGGLPSRSHDFMASFTHSVPFAMFWKFVAPGSCE